MIKSPVILMIFLFFIVTTSFAQQLKDIYLKDGTRVRGVVINRSGDSIVVEIGNEQILIKKTNIDRAELYIKKANIGKTSLPDNKIVFRNFLWTDNKDHINEKLSKIKGYYSLKEKGNGSTFGYNSSFSSETLAQIKRDLETCDKPIQSFETKPINKFVRYIVLAFSNLNDKKLVSVILKIKPKDANIVMNSLNEKYGEGEKVYNSNYTKWTNGNVILYADKHMVAYFNTKNLSHVRTECQMLKSQEYQKIESNIESQI